MRYTKLKNPLPRAERETSINRCWGEDIWTVWTSDPAEIRRYERGGYKPAEAEVSFDRRAALVPLKLTFR